MKNQKGYVSMSEVNTMARKSSVYKTSSFSNSPFAPKTAEEIFSDLAASRACYKHGNYQDFDDALDTISKKYGI
jgi:hypothetical protein